MAKRQRGGNAWKNGYSRYKGEARFAKNKVRRLEKYVSRNPNDAQAKKALERLKKEATYSRNTRKSGKGQTIASQRQGKLEASLRRASKHLEEFGQNRPKDPSENYMMLLMREAAEKLAGEIDKKLLRVING